MYREHRSIASIRRNGQWGCLESRRVALAQINTTVSDVWGNAERAADALKRATEGVGEIVAGGFEEEDVRRVIRIVDRAEYKRRQAPIGIKVTSRTFGRDRPDPMTNRYREQTSE